MNIEELDSNWVSPAALAEELGISRSTISSWITREQIKYIIIPGATHRRHLVDKRTAPIVQSVGRPKK
jgi:IS30 family transposase